MIHSQCCKLVGIKPIDCMKLFVETSVLRQSQHDNKRDDTVLDDSANTASLLYCRGYSSVERICRPSRFERRHLECMQCREMTSCPISARTRGAANAWPCSPT